MPSDPRKRFLHRRHLLCGGGACRLGASCPLFRLYWEIELCLNPAKACLDVLGSQVLSVFPDKAHE